MNREAIAERVARSLIADSADDYQKLYKEVSRGVAVLTSKEIHPDIPTMHNFAGRYHNTVEHLGFGSFRGHTDHGDFAFDGGGAMRREDTFSWTPLSADKPVLRDLRYDMNKVKRALKELLSEGREASERVAGADDLDQRQVIIGQLYTKLDRAIDELLKDRSDVRANLIVTKYAMMLEGASHKLWKAVKAERA